MTRAYSGEIELVWVYHPSISSGLTFLALYYQNYSFEEKFFLKSLVNGHPSLKIFSLKFLPPSFIRHHQLSLPNNFDGGFIQKNRDEG